MLLTLLYAILTVWIIGVVFIMIFDKPAYHMKFINKLLLSCCWPVLYALIKIDERNKKKDKGNYNEVE